MDSQGPIILEKSIKIEEVIKIANTSIIDIVTKTVTPEIKAPYELVDVEYDKMGSDYILSILVDKEGGITVEDTSDLTNIISPLLDTIDPDPFPNQYMLEVSSPGLERPLKTADSLKAAVDSYINVSLYQAIDKVKVFQGDLLAFDGETLTIDYLDKTRHKIVNIPYQAVAKVRMAVKL
ncbi:TPA: ribosome maturation factor RimP [Streptococcus pyogenes]|uniref:ribosome maturation factor RimP n=1 Tax=Streptococcus pyogenes TaxID=1314 RepID=UPI0010DDBE48|nr:ribosome maturation factor RimP [Streptococcus pyogenes]VGR01774.1 ribosome maturation factor rimP [Streptococcus pyogenes]VGV29912.1 ribosome maturation factor rimP [Streptococcus pyogenes]VHB96173.1 ribosome maturation factor rimP [Streptococcus pyogenes]VHL96836.1 ribosome maturation factor rimP [Streptococcus pyogenes]HEQ1442512.1 ribosome maturation factor RimP [Streptococcus pyogenes]